jgi:hypothetical protein
MKIEPNLKNKMEKLWEIIDYMIIYQKVLLKSHIIISLSSAPEINFV